MTASRPIVTIAVTLVLAACSPQSTPAVDSAAATDSASSAAVSPPASPDSTTGDRTRATPHVAIDGEGIRLVDSITGSTRPFAFGSQQTQVLSALERFRGAAAQGRNQECSLDYANWADGLSLTFRDGLFLGWSLDGRAIGAITTMSGVGVGSTRRDLDESYTASVQESTLGTEFTAGAMAGLIAGPSATDSITNMWAGEVCIAR